MSGRERLEESQKSKYNWADPRVKRTKVNQALTHLKSDLIGEVEKEIEELMPIAYEYYHKVTSANKDIASDFLAQTIRNRFKTIIETYFK